MKKQLALVLIMILATAAQAKPGRLSFKEMKTPKAVEAKSIELKEEVAKSLGKSSADSVSSIVQFGHTQSKDVQKAIEDAINATLVSVEKMETRSSKLEQRKADTAISANLSAAQNVLAAGGTNAKAQEIGRTLLSLAGSRVSELSQQSKSEEALYDISKIEKAAEIVNAKLGGKSTATEKQIDEVYAELSKLFNLKEGETLKDVEKCK